MLQLAMLSLLLPAIAHGDSKAEAETPKETNIKVILTFKGNSGLDEDELQEAAASELAAFRKNNFRKADLDDAAFRMELAYKKRGYAFAEVIYDVGQKKAVQDVIFIIHEGAVVAINKITFSGTENISSKRISRLFHQSYQEGKEEDEYNLFIEENTRQAVNQIADLYSEEGFMDSKVASPQYFYNDQKSRVDIEVEVAEGVQYILRDIVPDKEQPQEVIKAVDSVKSDSLSKPYIHRNRLLLYSSLLEVYANLGYPDVKIDIEVDQDKDTGDVILHYSCSPGEQVTITDVQFTGLDKTQKAFVENRVALLKGDIYTADAKRKSFQSLYETALFSKVDIELAEEPASGPRAIHVEVEELPSKEVYVEPGWGSYELLRFNFGWKENNFRGVGQQLHAEAKLSFKGENIQVSYRDPWFRNTQTSFNGPVYYRRRDEPTFSTEEIGASLIFSRKIFDSFSAVLTYQFSQTETTDAFSEELEAADFESYNKGTIRLQLTKDTRDDFFWPSKGMRLNGAVDLATTALGSDLRFYRYTIGYRTYFAMPLETIIALRYETGIVLPGSGQITLPLAEKFYNGGGNSMRGYDESELGPRDRFNDPTGGYGFNTASVELRRRLKKKFAASLFFDFGNISPNKSRSEQGLPPYNDRQDVIDDTIDNYFSDIKVCAGLGLHYLLPIGPARFDIAYNINEDESRGGQSFLFHFNLGMAF